VAYNFQTLLATKGACSNYLPLCSIDFISNKTFLRLHFHIPQAVLFCIPDLKIIGHENPDNNLESPCI
jgi:hypothetical protein